MIITNYLELKEELITMNVGSTNSIIINGFNIEKRTRLNQFNQNQAYWIVGDNDFNTCRFMCEVADILNITP